jgi:hypothetical protein
MLFGIDSRSINNIIIPHNLQELINNVKLVNSDYFCSEVALIKRMTLIPFYLAFLNKTDQKKICESLAYNGPINITKSLLGLKDLNCIDLDFKLKFCYQCWMEKNYMYFDIEHQVKNNNICYNHYSKLQYININSSDYFLFDNTCMKEYRESPYCISQNDRLIQCYKLMSSMIHDIFLNGFTDDIIKLKAKIREQMYRLDFMRYDMNFINRFDEFWLYYSKYNLLNIDKKELINAIYTTASNPNPIVYLTLINCLFGSLKSYYEYKIDEKHIRIINQKQTSIVSLTQPLKPYGLIYYNILVQKLYGDQFTIIRKSDSKYYEIRCSLCNYEWKIPQYYIRSKLVRCPNCEKK